MNWPTGEEDLDPNEKCVQCNEQIWRDEEGVWIHVLFDPHFPNVILAFRLVCRSQPFVTTKDAIAGLLEIRADLEES